MMILLKYIIVGATAGVGLIFLAKVVMAHLLQCDNDFYRDEFDKESDKESDKKFDKTEERGEGYA